MDTNPKNICQYALLTDHCTQKLDQGKSIITLSALIRKLLGGENWKKNWENDNLRKENKIGIFLSRVGKAVLVGDKEYGFGEIKTKLLDSMFT